MRKNVILTALMVFFLTGIYGQDSFVISGTIKNAAGDTLRCVLNENAVVRQSRTIYISLVNGSFKQTIQLSSPTYIYINDGTNYVNGLISPGEDIHITYDAKDLAASLMLSGSAKTKFEWANAWTSAKLLDKLKEVTKIAKLKTYPFDYLFAYLDSVQDWHLAKIQLIERQDPKSTHIMKAHVEGSIQSYKYSYLTRVFQEHISVTLATRAQQLTPASRKAIGALLRFNEKYHDAPVYVNSIYNILNMQIGELIYTKKMDDSLLLKLEYLDSLLPQKLKLPVMTMFIEDGVRSKKPAEEIQQLLDYASRFPGKQLYPEYIQRLLAERDTFKKGMKAPDFQLENDRGEKLSLASLSGKVVYLDFWYAACAPCHSLFASIKPVKEHFKNNPDVVFLTVSIDLKGEWQKALQKFKIAVDHAYTENRQRRHPIINDYRVKEYPTTLLIDKKGHIFEGKPSRDARELQAQIEQALEF